MNKHSFDDEEFERISKKLAEFEADSSTWGESEWNGEIDALSIWDWAEAKNRIDLMASIACNVAHQISAQAHFNPKDKNYQNWATRFTALAEQARLINQKEIHVKFLEAAWILNSLSYRQPEQIDKILSSYRQLDKPKKIAYYLHSRAWVLNHLAATGNRDIKEDEIWKSLIDVYQISKQANFNKGIALALSALGELLARKNKDVLALKFLYQAKIYSQIARTKFGTPAIEKLREIRDRSNTPTKVYETEIKPDALIDEFLKEIAS